MIERATLTAVAVDNALRDFENTAEERNLMKITDYVRLLDAMRDPSAEKPGTITLRWADKWKPTTENEP